MGQRNELTFNDVKKINLAYCGCEYNKHISLYQMQLQFRALFIWPVRMAATSIHDHVVDVDVRLVLAGDFALDLDV